MERLATGIEELDLVLDGGLSPGSLVVLAGAPGTGKTILAQQICFASATPDRKAIYYTTLSEPHSKLVKHLEPFSFFDAERAGRAASSSYTSATSCSRRTETGLARWCRRWWTSASRSSRPSS